MSFGGYAARTAVAWDRRAAGADWLVVEGSLLKVDLSGFTRLSERLARSEVTGAELLNATLNDVFVGLIDEILGRGGDVLQFGGDALVVWFEDDDHAVRAVAAARAMQRRVASRTAEPTPAGPVRLRMSAAVATGEVLFTVVGQDHRELLSLGPVATRVERLEKRAASGQVLVDQATAGLLPRREVREVDADVWLSRGAVSEGAPPAAPAPPAAEQAAAFVPPDVRDVEAAGEVTGEHRHAAAAFVGVAGLDGLLVREGPGAVVDAVRRVAAAVDEAVAGTRVTWTATDLTADGAVFLLFAGAPVAREDDEERMLRACRIVADRCAGLDVRVGAHAGRVFAADIGHPSRRTFAIIGDTTNLAARLMHRARVGEVLVTDELFDRSQQDHGVQWLEPFTVRGRRRPVRAGVLGAQVESRVARRTHDLPLVGRTEERERLHSLLAGVRGSLEDAPLTVALVGEPGVGKSRLVEATLEEAGDLDVLRVTATVFDTDTPYGAARAPLRGLLRLPPGPGARLAELAVDPELAPLLNLPLGLELPTTDVVAGIDPEFVETRRNELLADAVLTGRTRPLLVVVEDLHWLDRATVGLLTALARRAAPGTLGVLATSRTAFEEHLGTSAEWTACRLEPFGPEEARRLALALPGESSLSDSELDRLVADSGGNPLFLRELSSYRPAPGEPLPTTADEVIAARIDALGPGRRRLLRDTSVGGPVQRLRDAASTLGDEALARSSAWSGLGDFVVVDPDDGEPVLRFRHELYRQSAYQGLAVRRRRALHGSWADHLLAGDAPVSSATLAVHLHEAQRFREAWDWGRRAARDARAGGALSDAVPLYLRALDAGRRADAPADELAEVHEELGDTAELVGLYEQAEAAFRTAARQGSGAEAARRLMKRGTVLERQGRYRAALAQLTRASRRLDEGGDASVRTGLALRRSSVLHRLGRLKPAYDLAAHVARTTTEGAGVAAHVAAGSGPQLRGDRARALLRLEMIASEAGWSQRFDLGLEALAAFEGLDEDRDLACLLGNIGVTLAESDDWTGARRRYEESIEVYRRVGDVVGAAIATQNVGEILCDQGHLAEAEEVFREARRVFRAAGHSWGVACTASALGRVAARMGSPDEATALLDEAVDALDAMGSVVFAADARVRRVEAALLREAPHVVDLALSLVEELQDAEVGLEAPLAASRYLAVALAGAGSLDEAGRVASEALERSRDAGVVHEESLLLDVLTGLDVLEGRAPSPSLVSRRDGVWEQLGIVAAPRYPQIPRAGGARVVSSSGRTNCPPADGTPG